MKRVVFFLTFLVLSLVCFGQTESEHIKFMGIPIDGTQKAFINKLKAKGFEQDEMFPRILYGKFAGYSGCRIIIPGDENDFDSSFGMVTVIFPEAKDWEELSLTYDNLKRLTTKKYGEPALASEEFEKPYVNDSSSKFYEARMGRCNYVSLFKVEGGFITISIDYLKESRICFVTMKYVDNYKTEEQEREAIDDL